MTGSWRDDASPEAQADLDSLLDASLGFAQQQIEARGEFFPYAAAISTEGEPRMIAAMPGEEGQADSVTVLDVCLEALVNQREVIRAGAIVADVRLAEQGTDAIRVEVEHMEGQAITVLLPYTKKRLRRSVEFGEISAQPGLARIWAS